MKLSPSAHIDTFARDNLPPDSQMPDLVFSEPELQYPDRLNVAQILLHENIAKYGRSKVAVYTESFEGPETNEANDKPFWTYGELEDRVNQVAQLLTEDYGIVPGNRVMIRIPNNVWAIITWLATVKTGAIAVTTMVEWRSIELERTINKVNPSLIIVDHRFEKDVMATGIASLALLRLGGPDDQLKTKSAQKIKKYTAVNTAADDVVILAPTSGTTGSPKITMHFHRDLLAIADTFAKKVLRLNQHDISAGSPPLAFTFGLGGLFIFPFRTGGSVLLIEKPRPTTLINSIEKHGVTVLYTAPSGYRNMLKEGHAHKLSKLRVGVSAGEHLPKEVFEDVKNASGIKLVNGIGSTEMLHVFISASGDDIVPGATGFPVPGYKAAILDNEGVELPAGVSGRLAVKGPTGCRYLDEERQKNYVVNGWNVTGDNYIQDENGYFFFQCRNDDIIVTAGYNVAGPEIEAAIDKHPGVLESIVVGRPDPQKGEIVNAFVVLQKDVLADDDTRLSIFNFLKEGLATYKLPRRIDFVESLPRNPSGKLQRFPLKERAARESEHDLK